MNEELHLKLGEKMKEAKQSVFDICKQHIEKAKKFGNRYEESIVEDPDY